MHPSSSIQTDLVRQHEAELRRLARQHAAAQPSGSGEAAGAAAVSRPGAVGAFERVLAVLARGPYRRRPYR